jgi:hypothetical protein
MWRQNGKARLDDSADSRGSRRLEFKCMPFANLLGWRFPPAMGPGAD